MTEPHDWQAILRANAAAYAAIALVNIEREFPADTWHTWHGAADGPPRPRERTPVFWGSYDWHSSVEMFWLLVRLARLVPGEVPLPEIRAALDRRLTQEALAGEAAFIGHPDNRNRERPYGWGWGLALLDELARWDDADARRWADHAVPLGGALVANFLGWLPKATYPVRHGVHANSGFGLGLALPHAESMATAGNSRLLDAISVAALRWFADDADGPAAWEPSGFDFLSPVLVEAELMSRLVAPGAYGAWLDRFLPGLALGRPASIFTPAVVSDPTDGHIAHLHGLNLSRAWAWRRIAAALHADDQRSIAAAGAAGVHAAAGLPHVVGGDYMVEHWLAAYAVLLLA